PVGRSSPPPTARVSPAADEGYARAERIGSAARAASSLTWSASVQGTTSFTATACAGENGCFAFGLGGFLATSSDRRMTSWSMTSVPVLAHVKILAANCPTASRCIAIGEAPPTYGPFGGLGGVVFTSDDGGSSWAPALVSGSAVQFLGGLFCPGAKTCYATATRSWPVSHGFLLVSRDS